MNEELELKDIACYLPYGLKAQCKDLGILEITSVSTADKRYPVWCETSGCYKEDYNYDILFMNSRTWAGFAFSEIKPILRPMTDLVKPLPDGTIPIVALFMIASNNSIVESEIIIQSLIKNTVFIAHYTKSEILGFDTSTQSFFAAHKNKSCSPSNQVDLFNYLYAHHFDINDLIGRGLAIDINTISL